MVNKILIAPGIRRKTDKLNKAQVRKIAGLALHKANMAIRGATRPGQAIETIMTELRAEYPALKRLDQRERVKKKMGPVFAKAVAEREFVQTLNENIIKQ
ncbi:MAG: hypothetical protein WC861_05105 [Candidatus Micrarchaeia archaeon]|jgi:hypothetical protein